jgi:peroxiredoxin
MPFRNVAFLGWCVGGVILVAAGCTKVPTSDSTPIVSADEPAASPGETDKRTVTNSESPATTTSESPLPSGIANEKEMPKGSDDVAPKPPADTETPKPPAKDNAKPPAPKESPEPATEPANRSDGLKVAIPVEVTPDYVYKPKVVMSEGHAKTCLVKVGDAMPDLALADVAGDQHKWDELLGEKLTVVVFWSNDNRLGREQISRLNGETATPFKAAGVRVVAVNVGDPQEQIVDLLPEEDARDFTVLLDESGEAFGKVATDHLPRTYVLDAEGRIKWFDIEYSRSGHRDLINAIHVFLGNRKPAEPDESTAESN